MKAQEWWSSRVYVITGIVWSAVVVAALTFGFVSALRHMVWMFHMHGMVSAWLWGVIGVLGIALCLFWYRVGLGMASYRAQRQRVWMTLANRLRPLPQSLSSSLSQLADWHLASDNGERYALTWGLLRCHVAISQSLWDTLDPEARQAVLHHEAQHARVHDPLQQVILQVLAGALRPLGLGMVYQRYLVQREINADKRALAASQGDDLPLLTALQAAVGADAGMVSSVGLVGALEARLHYLETHESPLWPPSGLPIRLWVSLGAVLVTLTEGLLVWCHW